MRLGHAALVTVMTCVASGVSAPAMVAVDVSAVASAASRVTGPDVWRPRERPQRLASPGRSEAAPGSRSAAPEAGTAPSGPAARSAQPETAAPPSAAPVDEATVQEVAARLRCVVCQNLSVADSPSEMAHQMRAIIRERLVAGEAPDQVVRYFVDKYGEWILLSPVPRGFNLLVWAAPALAVLAGLVTVGFLLRRWTRPRPERRPAEVSASLRERVRRELEQGR